MFSIYIYKYTSNSSYGISNSFKLSGICYKIINNNTNEQNDFVLIGQSSISICCIGNAITVCAAFYLYYNLLY